MNKTETAYAVRLECERMAGRVLWWKFESVKLRLADLTFYSADFFVMLASGALQVHEVKGAKAIFLDDAKVKIKVAASIYPFDFIVAYPVKGGGWTLEPV